jgi:enoyl-CoA hydratase/carnithine racemase
MTELLRTAQVGAFDALILDVPSSRNALSLRLMEELQSRIAASASGPGRGLFLTHTGTSFCSGVDLRERRAHGPDDDSHSRLLADLFLTLWDYPKPVVIAVDGAVRGGGMGLLACGDVVIASPASTFAYSETKVGVAPALVMALTLHGIPVRRLLPWLLSGEAFTSTDALSLGLVTSVAESPGVVAAETTIPTLTAAAPMAQVTTKRLSRVLRAVDMPRAIADMTAESAALFTSEEAREGMQAFAERRTPAWARTQGGSK